MPYVRFWDFAGEEFCIDVRELKEPSTVINWKKYFSRVREIPVTMIELFKVVVSPPLEDDEDMSEYENPNKSEEIASTKSVTKDAEFHMKGNVDVDDTKTDVRCGVSTEVHMTPSNDFLEVLKRKNFYEDDDLSPTTYQSDATVTKSTVCDEDNFSRRSSRGEIIGIHEKLLDNNDEKLEFVESLSTSGSDIELEKLDLQVEPPLPRTQQGQEEQIMICSGLNNGVVYRLVIKHVYFENPLSIDLGELAGMGLNKCREYLYNVGKAFSDHRDYKVTLLHEWLRDPLMDRVFEILAVALAECMTTSVEMLSYRNLEEDDSSRRTSEDDEESRDSQQNDLDCYNDDVRCQAGQAENGATSNSSILNYCRKACSPRESVVAVANSSVFRLALRRFPAVALAILRRSDMREIVTTKDLNEILQSETTGCLRDANGNLNDSVRQTTTLMDALRFHCHFRCPALILELLSRDDLTYETLTYSNKRGSFYHGKLCKSALDIVRTYAEQDSCDWKRVLALFEEKLVSLTPR